MARRRKPKPGRADEQASAEIINNTSASSRFRARDRSDIVADMKRARERPRRITAAEQVPEAVRAASGERWRAEQAELERFEAAKAAYREAHPIRVRLDDWWPLHWWPRYDRFPPGTVVYLQGGSLPMTVNAKLRYAMHYCEWFDRNENLKHERFPDSMLTRHLTLPPSN